MNKWHESIPNDGVLRFQWVIALRLNQAKKPLNFYFTQKSDEQLNGAPSTHAFYGMLQIAKEIRASLYLALCVLLSLGMEQTGGACWWATCRRLAEAGAWPLSGPDQLSSLENKKAKLLLLVGGAFVFAQQLARARTQLCAKFVFVNCLRTRLSTLFACFDCDDCCVRLIKIFSLFL